RRIEGEIGSDRVEMLRIERQHRLQSLQGIKRQETHEAEGQHGNAITLPVLLLIFLDAAEPIESPLDRTQQRRQECTLAVEDARHIEAERLHEKCDDHAIECDLNETIGGHKMLSLKTLGSYQGDDEVDE